MTIVSILCVNTPPQNLEPNELYHILLLNINSYFYDVENKPQRNRVTFLSSHPRQSGSRAHVPDSCWSLPLWATCSSGPCSYHCALFTLGCDHLLVWISFMGSRFCSIHNYCLSNAYQNDTKRFSVSIHRKERNSSQMLALYSQHLDLLHIMHGKLPTISQAVFL